MHLNSKTHRFISLLAISIISFVGLESLVYINNLYQIPIYVMASGYIYLLLLIWLYFLFDLHFKDRGHLDALTIWHSVKRRIKHFHSWEHFRYFQNFLILPGVLYWSSIILIGINFGHQKLQHFIAVATSLALVFSYSMFKEVFHQKELPINNNHFIVLTYVKVYAAWLVFSGSLGIVWYYCLNPHLYYALTFAVTLMLLYQALFQFCTINLKNVTYAVLISLGIAVASVFVYDKWNVNYFSAGLFLTAVYNFCWNLLYHHIKKTLDIRVLFEQTALLVLLLVMVFGITNFRARIERCIF
jgi:hypothetical protein